MYNKLLFIILIFSSQFCLAQNCELKLEGFINDSGTGLPLAYANILILENQSGQSTDSLGFFSFSDICAGEYHIAISHVGCESQDLFLNIQGDTSLILTLEHSHNVLHDVVVTGEAGHRTTLHKETISEQDIIDKSDKNLSQILESIAGVSSLKNGNGIAKPVVHGLYGNRVTILNNGIAQSGQQWGNDHSPEIDPLVANKITIIKGTSSLEYMGSNLGSVILVEPKKIAHEPHLHGRANYFYETNGRGQGANIQLQQESKSLAWGINGTFKRSGDKKTLDYFLTNTGLREANLAVQLEKSLSAKVNMDLYLSTFNAQLGVLRGSHIGNLTDLQSALERNIPFFTEESFSSSIAPPKHQVHHHLLKLHSSYFINDHQWMDFSIATQINNRKEFDVRRSGRSDIAALNLLQYSFFVEAKYQKETTHDQKLKAGIQFNAIDNTNNPETGILPLIPDYLSYNTGAYAIFAQQVDKSLLEVGVRYDNTIQKVVAISNTTPREIIRYNNNAHNLSGSLGWNYTLNDHLRFTSNLGYAIRNPDINELYSNGLHQGVSGIEQGNINLNREKSLKGTFLMNSNIESKFFIEALAYFQQIDDYIILAPQDEVRLTIRGAFPVFSYEQTDAQIYGLDLSGKYEITPSWHTTFSWSMIKGKDRSNNIPLINIPSNNIKGDISYAFSKPIALGKTKLDNLEIKVNNQYVFQQDNLLASQDFVLPPDAYNLVGIEMSTDVQLKKTRLRVLFKLDNVFNVKFRDYLNRQRYFADDTGFNSTLGVSLKF